MSGWIRLSKSIFDHEEFAGEPLSRREAWLWLIVNAAWKDTKHRVGNVMVEVPRGTLVVSLRRLASEWKWPSEKRVRGFLDALEREEMIGRKMDAGRTHLTICNYNKYQDAPQEMDAARTQRGRTKGTREQINKEGKARQKSKYSGGDMASIASELAEEIRGRRYG